MCNGHGLPTFSVATLRIALTPCVIASVCQAIVAPVR